MVKGFAYVAALEGFLLILNDVNGNNLNKAKLYIESEGCCIKKPTEKVGRSIYTKLNRSLG